MTVAEVKVEEVKEERVSQRRSNNAKRKAQEAGLGDIPLVAEPPQKLLRTNDDQEGMPEVRQSFEKKRRLSKKPQQTPEQPPLKIELQEEISPIPPQSDQKQQLQNIVSESVLGSA